MVESLPNPSFYWVYREANKAAYNLAKYSLHNWFVGSFDFVSYPLVWVMFLGWGPSCSPFFCLIESFSSLKKKKNITPSLPYLTIELANELVSTGRGNLGNCAIRYNVSKNNMENLEDIWIIFTWLLIIKLYKNLSTKHNCLGFYM